MKDVEDGIWRISLETALDLKKKLSICIIFICHRMMLLYPYARFCYSVDLLHVASFVVGDYQIRRPFILPRL
jgi:hypothetical protein